MTRFIAYHPSTPDVALFETNGVYWIGCYWSAATHQNGEPPYFLNREVDSEEEGRHLLQNTPEEQFD